ncbi:nudix-type nucleoside diphosphatase, YffH/AdpP family [Paracoccus halophilus]|uniref:ADP-ribose pyrophosphatase n=1 Tax=Paracoccus halophilus TaxID=376733 RepID=A0A099F793_9RHOB|nr:NUDIX domain-containing protein [Paracoccus halophilus]KGJ06545.1 NUDIX hydrolase [Paracoccus halophilus]SFA37786.1 nudix-type nucleoside diphosphatase, YffH/AdpP family [Paracoccus halophilus]
MLLIGVLAHPTLRDRLAPGARPAEPLTGWHLVDAPGRPLAGVDADHWPVIQPGDGKIAAWDTGWTPALRRYAEIFGLRPLALAGQEVLGARLADGAGAIASAKATGAGVWCPELALAMAEWVLNLPEDRPASDIRERLPMIATWVSARRRAQRDTAHLPQIGPEGQERLQIMSCHEPYAKFFSVEELVLRQRRHRGDWSPRMLRAVFVSGDATVVLPYDPVRDRVLLIDQLRAAPVARGDCQPWFHETVAGRVDPGETPEEAGLREAMEEAGLHIRRLIPGPHNYPSPGILAEFLYLYVGLADLPDAAAGFGGLDSEEEDIRSFILPRAELTRMAMTGEIRNGPLLSLALWLELSHLKIRGEPCAETSG